MCSPLPAADESPLPGHDGLHRDGFEYDGLECDGHDLDGLDLQIKCIECINYDYNVV